jgi:triacylglycerol lipase
MDKKKLSTNTPIIALLPGLFAFDRLLFWRMFSGVKQRLERNGCLVIQVKTDPVASIRDRSIGIANQIDSFISETLPHYWSCEENRKSIHLIGHSMGGLDARFLASPGGLNWGDRVVTVTTLATPHRGSPAADRLATIAPLLIKTATKFLWRFIPLKNEREFVKKVSSGSWEAILNLTPHYLCDTFNREIVNHPEVKYLSYSAIPESKHLDLVHCLRQIQARIGGLRGTNHDGLVEIDSAKWGEYIRECTTDHGGIIGLRVIPWLSDGFNHLQLFDEIWEKIKNH